jgi:hypothetical protein
VSRFRELHVYRELIGKIGLLRTNETEVVIRAYGQLSVVMAYLDEQNRQKGSNYYQLNPRRSTSFSTLSGFALADVEDALRELGAPEPRRDDTERLALYKNEILRRRAEARVSRHMASQAGADGARETKWIIFLRKHLKPFKGRG